MSFARLLLPPTPGATVVDIRRRRVAADGMGGQIVEWQAAGEQPARISSPPTSTTNAVLSAAQTSERVPFYAYLLPDADVRRGDLLVDRDDGRQLYVESITRPSVKAMQRASCRQTQVEPQEPAGEPTEPPGEPTEPPGEPTEPPEPEP